MSFINQELLIKLSIGFSFYFVIGFFGAFMKDFYETITKKHEAIRMGHILIGAFSTAFLMVGIEHYLVDLFTFNTIVLITFILGILGFEIFSKISTINKFKNFLISIIEFKRFLNSTNKDKMNDVESEKDKKK